jgi:hypothetical protein
MYEEKLDVEKHLRQRQRLQALIETQVWKDDIKPFLMGKITAARTGIFHSEDDSTHWQSVGIYGHIEHLIEFIEDIKVEDQLWQKREQNESPEKKTLQTQHSWWKRALRKREKGV